jgi:2-polyprenyl-3-methyl-5-hydroxy-6-metoxy-1,4-benzoquinol methylase
MDKKQHWEQVYTTKTSDNVSWFQRRADQSLDLIHNTGLGKDAAIIDIGGGASKLVDNLLEEGYTDLTVLDLSSAALDVVKQRLGHSAESVQWIAGDITKVELPVNRFDIWHDRAVFHFLTDPADRQAYVEQAMSAVRPNGHVIIATFSEDGPEKCSGLPVIRYKPETLHAEFGENFLLVSHEKEAHGTPFGTVQQFVYCYFRKRND